MLGASFDNRGGQEAQPTPQERNADRLLLCARLAGTVEPIIHHLPAEEMQGKFGFISFTLSRDKDYSLVLYPSHLRPTRTSAILSRDIRISSSDGAVGPEYEYWVRINERREIISMRWENPQAANEAEVDRWLKVIERLAS